MPDKKLTLEQASWSILQHFNRAIWASRELTDPEKDRGFRAKTATKAWEVMDDLGVGTDITLPADPSAIPTMELYNTMTLALAEAREVYDD